jgi:hypothetical protein
MIRRTEAANSCSICGQELTRKELFRRTWCVGLARWCDALRLTSGMLGLDRSQPIYRDRKDDGVAYRLNQAHGDFHSAGMKDAARGSELVGNLLPQLDLKRFHPPRLTVQKESGDVTDHLAVCCDDGSSA